LETALQIVSIHIKSKKKPELPQAYKSTKPDSNPHSRKGGYFSCVFSTALRLTNFLSKNKIPNLGTEKKQFSYFQYHHYYFSALWNLN